MPAEDYPLEVSGAEVIGIRRPERRYTVKRYDFRRPDKFSWDQIRTFTLIHETIARELHSVLSTTLGRRVEVSADGADQMTMGEFLDRSEAPGGAATGAEVYAAVTMAPLRGAMVLRLDAPLATWLLRGACGQRPTLVRDGNGVSDGSSGRDALTEVEAVVLRAVCEQFLPAVAEGWRRVSDVVPEVSAIESDPRGALTVEPTEMVITARLAVHADGASTGLSFAVPYLMVEPLVARLTARSWYAPVRPAKPLPLVGGRADGLPVACELAVPLGRVRLSELPGILGGAPAALPTANRGLVELRAGGVAIARLRAPAGDHPAARFELECAETPRAERAGARDGDRQTAAASARLEASIRAVAEDVRELRFSVETIREDRDARSSDLVAPSSPAGLEAILDSGGAVDLALHLSAETPETLAFILAPLPRESAGRLFAALRPELHAEVVRALVTLSEADLSLHRRVAEAIARRLARLRQERVTGGVDRAAALLTHAPRGVEKALMERFREEERPLFDALAARMFVFEDFVLVDPRSIRMLMERVAVEELALALKGVPANVAAHITGALSEEQVAALRQAAGSLGRARRADVEAAQRDVIEELRALDAAGKVVVTRPGEAVD